MGRPVNKRYLGPTGVDAQATIPVRADVGGTDFEGYILNQKGSTKFTVSNDGGSVQGVCYLVNKITGHNAGECSIVGLNTAGEPKAIKRIKQNKLIDYDNVIYTWAVEDDSAESMLRLTAV